MRLKENKKSMTRQKERVGKKTYCCYFHRGGSGVRGYVSRDRSRVPKFGTGMREEQKVYKIDCM
jgi:hypothetical protein